MPRFRSIELDELIEILQEARKDHGGEIQVIFGADYGDHGHTTQALDIEGEVEKVSIEQSGYSHSGFAIVDEEEDEEGLDLDDDEPVFLRIK
jgi:hypothetical protein